MKINTTQFLKGSITAALLISMYGISNGQSMSARTTAPGISNSVIQPQTGFTMSPNPANVYTDIRVNNYTQSFRVRVFNSSGMLMYDKGYPSFIEEIALDVTSYPPGLYNVMVISAGHSYLQHLIVN